MSQTSHNCYYLLIGEETVEVTDISFQDIMSAYLPNVKCDERLPFNFLHNTEVEPGTWCRIEVPSKKVLYFQIIEVTILPCKMLGVFHSITKAQLYEPATR